MLIKENNRVVIDTGLKKYYLYKIADIDRVINQFEIAMLSKKYYKFVYNIFNSIITEYNGFYYTLLEANNNEIVISNIYVERKKILSWKVLWIKKVDYVQRLYDEIKGKYKIVDESFNYYIGLWELAIYYMQDYGDYFEELYLEHVVINDEYYNPLNIKLDIKERDFAEYMKYIFWNSTYKDVDIHQLISKYRKFYDYNLVMARMLYPNYYFDLLDDIALGNKDEIVLRKIIARSGEFETYVSEILNEIKDVS